MGVATTWKTGARAMLCVLPLWIGCGPDEDAGQVDGAAVPLDASVPAVQGSSTTDAQTSWPAAEAGMQPTATAEPSFCVVQRILHARCGNCHSESLAYGAPMALVDWDDTQQPSTMPGVPVYAAMAERLHSGEKPMPPLGQPQLEASELAEIDAWLGAGAPAPDAACTQTESGAGTLDGGAPVDEAPPAWPAECEEFYELRAGVDGQPYEVAPNSEERKSFEIPVPWSGQVYALAIRPLTDNKRVVHHWILYEGSFSMVTSWSPGKEFETFADGVGVYMPPSGNLRLEMHYYNLGNDQAELDDSGVEVCVTRSPVEHVATTYMFSGPASVPAQQRVTNVGECTVISSDSVHLITSSPHMHSYGVAAKFEVIRQNGDVDVLHDTPFDWQDQSIKPIDVELHAGDTVRTTCVYENDTNRDIAFGEDSADEMCFNFARYYPKDGLFCL